MAISQRVAADWEPTSPRVIDCIRGPLAIWHDIQRGWMMTREMITGDDGLIKACTDGKDGYFF